VRCIADTAPQPELGIPLEPVAGGEIFLRNFHPRDIPRIAEIVGEALREHYEPSLYTSLSQQWPQGFLVAQDRNGVPQAFLLGVSQVPGEARVLMFAVDGRWRERGVGSRLMEVFMERCRGRGMTRMTLEVRVGNATAIRFYTRFGFSVTDLLRGYYSDGENGYQMGRDL
jgi:[ribosomal protein S18]-alanine N-acetyltransferase